MQKKYLAYLNAILGHFSLLIWIYPLFVCSRETFTLCLRSLLIIKELKQKTHFCTPVIFKREQMVKQSKQKMGHKEIYAHAKSWIFNPSTYSHIYEKQKNKCYPKGI